MEPERGADQRPFLARRLAESPEYREEVEAAERLGISLRRFRGWEPVTRYEHDDAGRLVASQPEPEWDERSQAEMLALAAYRRSRCPNCGGDLAETTAPENEGRYEHQPPVQCHRCVAYARAADAYADQPHPHTFLHIVKLRPRRG